MMTIRNDGPRNREGHCDNLDAGRTRRNDLLSRDPLGLLIAMLLDQQVPLETRLRRLMTWPAAWGTSRAPRNWPTTTRRRSPPCSRNGLTYTHDPKSMAARVQALSRLIVDRYDGDASRVWGDAADGTDLRKRVAELPGFGAQKAQIFVALLGKQLGVRPAGWREAAGGCSVTRAATARSRTSPMRIR